MSTVHDITEASAFEKITTSLPSGALQVLYFHAPWAAPCAQMSAIISALASTYAPTNPPSIAFLSLNAEDLPDISDAHDVTAVPLVVLRRGDQEVQRISGSDAEKLRDAIERHAGNGASQNTAGSSTQSNGRVPVAQSVTRPVQPLAQAPSESSGTAQKEGEDASTLLQHAPTSDLGGSMPGAKDAKTVSEPDGLTKAGMSAGLTNAVEEQNGDLTARLEELTRAAPCMLFMKGTPSAPQCGFSRQLVGILREQGVRYGFFNILADDEVRQGLKEYADWPTFPQLWLSGELVGGLDIVREEMEGDPEFFKEYSVKKGQLGAQATVGTA